MQFHYPVQALKVKFSCLLRSIEFANQLWTLHNEVPKNSSNFEFVSNWLVTALCDEDAEMASRDEFPVVVKKLRDEALGKTPQFAFRRSRLYMCMNALLQHNLTMQLGAETGKLLYKGIMLQFITKICDAFKTPTTFDVGLMIQMMAKLARRAEKLSALVDQFDEHLSDEIDEMITCAIHNTKTTIKALRRKIDAHIDKLQSEDEKSAQLPPLTELNFETDVKQKVPKLRDYLDKRESEAVAMSYTSKNTKKYLRHKFDVFNAPPANYFGECSDKTEINLRLIDLEKWISYDVDSDDFEMDAKTIRDLSITYAKTAAPFYEGDPFATSIMILVRLKLISMLDKIACNEISLMSKFHSAINPNIIKTLLLHQRNDLEIASELEDYFTERNERASGPSLIGEKSVSTASFSSVYAAQNETMQSVRNSILEEMKNKVYLLEIEYTKACDKVAKLRLQERNLSHDKRWTKKGIQCHNCTKCSLKKGIKNTKLKQYVKSLPEHEYEQNAIVFELLIPDTIIIALNKTPYDSLE